MSYIEHDRQSKRLNSFDYSKSGYYFITICAKNREHLFGIIKNRKIILNNYGQIVKQELIQSEICRPNIVLNEYIIMPNHIHMILEILNVGAWRAMPTHTRKFGNRIPGTVSTIIGSFKSSVTKKINESRKYNEGSIWQRNFHDRIIRNNEELYKIKQYIRLNPYNWENDELNRG